MFEQCLKKHKKADAILLAYWCAFSDKMKYYFIIRVCIKKYNVSKQLEGYIDKENILD